MLELAVIFILSRKIAVLAKKKGRDVVSSQIVVIISWIGTELFIGFLGGVYLSAIGRYDSPVFGLAVYVFSIAGATFMTLLVFRTMKKLPDLREMELLDENN